MRPTRKDLTEDDFNRLLAWLDSAPEPASSRYEEIRQRLIVFFDRRAALNSEELADETLDRVAKRLAERPEQQDSRREQYCYGVARNVLHEYMRRPESRNVPLEESPETTEIASSSNTGLALELAKKEEERMFQALEVALKSLSQDDRYLIINYYEGSLEGEVKRKRQELSERLGLSPMTMRTRAMRIRRKLKAALKKELAREPRPKVDSTE
jgi:RNA polymerase sigma factor (sigma-70 family)